MRAQFETGEPAGKKELLRRCIDRPVALASPAAIETVDVNGTRSGRTGAPSIDEDISPTVTLHTIRNAIRALFRIHLLESNAP